MFFISGVLLGGVALLALFTSLGGDGNGDEEGGFDKKAIDEGGFDPQPVPLPDPDDDIEIQPVPAPGVFYQVEQGDTLAAITNLAYGTSGLDNIRRQQAVNLHPLNGPYIMASNSAFTQKWYPMGWVRGALFPDWGCTGIRGFNRDELLNNDDGCFGVLYIPTNAEVAQLT